MDFISEDLQTIMAIHYNLDSSILVSRILPIKTHYEKIYFFCLRNDYNKQIKVFVSKKINKVEASVKFEFQGQIVEKSFLISKPIKVNQIINFINKILSYYELETELSNLKYRDKELL